MSDFDILKKEIDDLRKENQKLHKRVNQIEGKSNDSGKINYIHKKTSLHNIKRSEKSENSEPNNFLSDLRLFIGIMFIIVGILLSLYNRNLILGGILVIVGVIVLNLKKEKIETKSDVVYKKQKESRESKESGVNVVTSYKNTTNLKVKESNLESNIGVKWFAYIGILALVIGVGFFIKYAIDNGWISHLTRIILGTLLGIVLVVLGKVLSKKERYDILGKCLIGGGIAIVYFMVYAAYYFPDYREAIGINLFVDIILMIIVVVLSIILTLKEGSEIIASEAFLLGYITALLSNELMLLTLFYTLFLTIGLIIIVMYKKWTLIGIGGIILTYISFLVWQNNHTDNFFMSFIFLSLYFISFTIQSIVITKNNKKEGYPLVTTISIILNSLFYFLLSYFILVKDYPQYDALFVFILSLIYLSIAYFLRNDDTYVPRAYFYIGIMFLTMSIPLQFNNELITIIWAIQGIVLVLLYTKSNEEALRYSAYFVGVLTFFKTLLIDSSLNGFSIDAILSSTRIFSFLATIITFYLIAYLIKISLKKIGEEEMLFSYMYSWGASILTVLIIILEFSKVSYLVTVLLCLFALILILFSKIENVNLKYQSFVVSLIIIFKLLVIDWQLRAFDFNDLLGSKRFIAYVISIIIFYIISYYLSRNKDEKLYSDIYSSVGTLLTVILIIFECSNESYLISIFLAIFSLVLILISRLENDILKYQSFVVLFIVSIKLLLIDCFLLKAFDMNNLLGSTRFITFSICIFIFYAISYYLSTKKSEELYSNIILWIGSVSLFLIVMLEFKEFWISLAWAIIALALLFLGFSYSKHLRLQGLFIFGITILKVFLFDTRNLDTIYRTISFITLGIILLIASYFYAKNRDKLMKIL